MAVAMDEFGVCLLLGEAKVEGDAETCIAFLIQEMGCYATILMA